MSLIKLKRKVHVKDIVSVNMVQNNDGYIVSMIINNDKYKYYDKRINGMDQIYCYALDNPNYVTMDKNLSEYNYIKIDPDSIVSLNTLVEDLTATLKAIGLVVDNDEITYSIMDKLRTENVVSFEKVNNEVVVEELCDVYYSINLSKDELSKLIEELSELHDELD